MTNLAVIYYSATGTTDQMARRCEEAGASLGAKVRRRRVAEHAPPEAIAANPEWSEFDSRIAEEPVAAPEDMVWADAVLLGTPTRYGNVASQLKQFLDSLGGQWSRGELADKTYAGFTSSMTAHGGQESTLLALYQTIYHFGGILVSPGYTDPVKFEEGNPYGVSHVTGGSNDAPLGKAQLAALDHLTERVVHVAESVVPALGRDRG